LEIDLHIFPTEGFEPPRGANSIQENPDGDQESNEEVEEGQENFEHQDAVPLPEGCLLIRFARMLPAHRTKWREHSKRGPPPRGRSEPRKIEMATKKATKKLKKAKKISSTKTLSVTLKRGFVE
jgi:hypothetical protein